MACSIQLDGGAPIYPDVVESKPKRIDSTDNRETLFSIGSSDSKRTSWLSEADVDFFTGGGVTESSSAVAAPSADQQATIQRRLVVGGLIAAGLAAFAFIPTRALRLKPSKPLFFYILALLQLQEQLAQCKDIIENAQWDNLRLILPRIKGSPGNIEENLYNAVSLIQDGKAAAKAEALVGDIMEYLDKVDYNKYFDAMPSRKVG
eukprot:jgi/Chrzof1/3658/Cz13g04020.t1